MFDELEKYKNNDHFFFKADQDLETVCNAPTDKSGVYLIYQLKDGKIELVFIGRSGKKNLNGDLLIRKSGLGGLKDRIVNGKQFGKPRKLSWKSIMQSENIEALDIYWYATHNTKYQDCPKKLKNKLLQIYYEIYGNFPKWNDM